MEPKFDPEFFAGNRRRLRELLDSPTPIVVTANGLLQRNSDMAFPFRQDASFWYLSGIDEPDMVLVMLEHEEFLIAPARTEVQDIFDGSLNWRDLKHRSGIKSIVSKADGWKKLQPTVKRTKRVATLSALPQYIDQVGMYTNPARACLVAKLTELNSSLEFTDIRSVLAEMRLIKQKPEIAAIRKAVNVTCDTLLEVQKRQYGYEYELEADLTHLFRSSGAQGHAYAPIVGGGLNACTLHYDKNNSRLRRGRLVLVDAGALVGQYSADITRTWPIGKPTARQAKVLQTVNEAVELGISQLKPENSFAEAERHIREFIGQKLKELKLVNKITKHSVRQYYPHSPHYLGLDVHDVGDPNVPLQPGMVMTLEPGIYIPEEFIGVRIEENILITEKGPEVLSKRLPRLLL